MSNLVGKIIGHYRLDQFVGDGGMGTVYKAYDTYLARTVALKLMHAHYARQPEFQARLTQEAKTAAMLDHPNIVRIYDFGESEEGLFIAMEYIGGGNLRAHLRNLQTKGLLLPLKHSLQIGAQMAEALDYAHGKGVIHRDMKPSNIILKEIARPDKVNEINFRAILTDFGLVKLVEGGDLTRTGTTLGTPTYMSPEQCEGLTLDGRSDLYSLGVVLYELLTNRLPFQFKSLSEAMATHMRGDMPYPPRSVRSDLPPIMDNILSKLLAKAPSDRYQSGEALSSALRSAMIAVDEEPTQVIIGGGPQPPRNDAENPADAPPQGYQVEIITPGRESSFAALSRPTITIGRNVDNDIVLPAEGVSRYHTRLQAAHGGWAAVDLGGVNGTWLGERKLEPDRSTSLKPGDTLQIGPYQLKLKGPPTVEQPTIAEPQSSDLPTNIRETVPYNAPAQDPSDAPIELFLARDTLSVEPGRREEINVEVVNRSQQDDRVNLKVFGVPSDWVQIPDTFITVPAGDSTTIPIVFQPPRRAETPAGRQRVRIELNSQQFRNSRSAVSLNLILGIFEDFTVEMAPRNLKLPGMVQVTLHNTGNAPAEYSLVGRESGNNVQFRGERGRIRLLPDQVATVDLQLEPRSQSWLGGFETFGFEVEVASRSGARHAVSGNAETSPIIPISLGYGALFLVIFLCALSGLLLVQGWFSPNRETATPTATVNPFGTATSVSATQTAVASATLGAGSLTPGTTAPPGDIDSDGLSDAQEALIGTQPDNPDTDGDGLLDGKEVLELGTSPTKRDTDGDTLSDGDEFNLYKTNPLKIDTDGDGITDGAEIANGTDPLNPADGPINTPTATLPPTNTPTITATPGPGSLPDLVIPFTPAITYESTGCLIAGTSLGTRVTVRNIGTVAATASFIVSINGTQRTVNGLEAGNVVSIWVPGNINPTVIVVDITNTVTEGDETNNTFNGSVPVPTQPAPCTITPAPTGIPSPSVTPTFTPPPTGLPSPTTTVSPTPSETPSPTPTGTATETPSPTPTNTPGPVVNPLVNCATIVPTLDGTLQPNEWGLLPMVNFGPLGAPENQVTVYFLKDAANYYLAFEIGDTTLNQATDSLRLYFDVTKNAGDPDSTDRFFQITRDNTLTLQSGTASNADGLDWDPTYVSNKWEAVVGETGGNSWVIEMRIDAAEMPVLADGNAFGMMSTVLYNVIIYNWPEGSISDNAGTWQQIDNQICP